MIQGFPKKKEDYKKYEMMCFNLLHISECVYDTSIGECRQKKKEDCSDYKKALMKEETFEQYNQAIDDCQSAVMKKLDKEKIKIKVLSVIIRNRHNQSMSAERENKISEQIAQALVDYWKDYMKGEKI